VAAGALILEEAGGKVTDFEGGGQFLFGGQLLATNRYIHDELKEIISRHFQ
jgi:myo-inositol-1(or 4)-monophosphatase